MPLYRERTLNTMPQKLQNLYDRLTGWVSRHKKILMLALAAAAVLPYLVISLYSRPCVDDFGYSSTLYQLVHTGRWNPVSLLAEALRVDIEFYNTWQGLYVSAFVLALQPGIFGEKFYCLGAVLLILLMAICLRYFVGVCFELCGISVNRTIAAAIILMALLQGLPSTAEGLYWFNGAWNYMPYFFLSLANLALLLRYISPKGRTRQLVSAVLLGLLISGGNHVTSFLNILLLTFLLLLCGRQHRLLVLPWLSAVAGFAVMYAAPGTAVRKNAVGGAGVISTLFHSLKQAEDWLAQWSDVHWFLFMGLAFGLALHIRPSRNRRLPNPLWVLAAGGTVFCGELCVPYYAMSSFGENRIKNIFWMSFLILSAVIVIYTVVWFNHKGRPDWLDCWMCSAGWQTMLVLLTAALVFHTGTNAKDILRELLDGTAQSYAAQYDARVADMQQLSEGEVLYTHQLIQSTNLYYNDVGTDPDSGWNAEWRDYYGCSIAISGD